MASYSLKHLGTNREGNQYQCSYCDKEFLRRSNLTVHLKIHTSTKPYKCNQSKKNLSQNCHLKLHLRTHSCPWVRKDRSKKCQQWCWIKLKISLRTVGLIVTNFAEIKYSNYSHFSTFRQFSYILILIMIPAGQNKRNIYFYL